MIDMTSNPAVGLGFKVAGVAAGLKADGARDFTLIVHTTPLGMYPDVESCPGLPFSLLDHRHFVYDLVYNPAETLLLQRSKARGAAVKNGLEMLHLQAEAAWAIWQD